MRVVIGTTLTTRTCSPCLSEPEMLIMVRINRHPVTNEYLPIQFQGDEFLRKEGDKSGKMWDEQALREWELRENHGQSWSGRTNESQGGSDAA